MAKEYTVRGIIPKSVSTDARATALRKGASRVITQPAVNPNHEGFEATFKSHDSAEKFRTWLNKHRVA